MSRIVSTVAPVVLALGLLATGAMAEEQAASPDLVKEVRELFAMQDLVAAGQSEGLSGQRRILSELKAKEPKLAHDAVAETGMAYALTAYVLSGGQPERAEAYAGLEGLPPHAVRMLKGSAAFMRGDPKTAQTLLSTVDPLLLPPAYGGRIALTRAMLADPRSREREQLLAMAMALMPGTLVEEAALRRSALAQAENHDTQAFWKRTSRYVRRFRHSLYAPDFIAGLSGQLLRFHHDGKPAGLETFDALLMAFPAAQRRRLYLQLARQATSGNAPDIARFAGRRIVRLAVPGSLEQQQGELYSWAHAIAGPEQETAWEHLKAIDGSRLDDTDRALLEAALHMIRQIGAAPATDGLPAAEPEDATSALQALETRVTALMTETETVLGTP